jgi:hypothetical protein
MEAVTKPQVELLHNIFVKVYTHLLKIRGYKVIEGGKRRGGGGGEEEFFADIAKESLYISIFIILGIIISFRKGKVQNLDELSQKTPEEIVSQVRQNNQEELQEAQQIIEGTSQNNHLKIEDIADAENVAEEVFAEDKNLSDLTTSLAKIAGGIQEQVQSAEPLTTNADSTAQPMASSQPPTANNSKWAKKAHGIYKKLGGGRSKKRRSNKRNSKRRVQKRKSMRR